MKHHIPRNQLHVCSIATSLKRINPTSFRLDNNTLKLDVVNNFVTGTYERSIETESTLMVKSLKKRNWKIIKKYKVELKGYLTKKHFILIALQLKRVLRNIRHFSLNITLKSNIAAEESVSFGFHIIKELKDLKHLSLNFQNGYASGLKAKLLKYLVANCIKSHENLDKLSLRVPEYNTDTSNRVEKRYSIWVKYLWKLQYIELDFSMPSDPSTPLYHIVKIISRKEKESLTHLPGIRLNLFRSSLCTDQLKHLLWQIGSNKPPNSHFYLDIYSCWELSKEFVPTLTEHLSSTLKNLILTCGNSLTIEDKGIQEFASQIGSQLKSLEHLELNFDTHIVLNLKTLFESCGKITDSSLTSFAMGIQNNGFKALEELNLHLYSRRTITFHGLKVLFESINNSLTCLHSLSMSFPNCSKMVNEDINMLTTEAKRKLNKLNRILLELDN